MSAIDWMTIDVDILTDDELRDLITVNERLAVSSPLPWVRTLSERTAKAARRVLSDRVLQWEVLRTSI